MRHRMQLDIDKVKAEATSRVEHVSKQLEMERTRAKDNYEHMQSQYIRDAENIRLELADTKLEYDERVAQLQQELRKAKQEAAISHN